MNPDKDFNLFVYDPGELEFTYFNNFDNLCSYAFDLFRSIVSEYGGWDESIDDIVIGVVTHKPEKHIIHKRPPSNELNKNNFDANGNLWPPGMKEMFEYKISQLKKEHGQS